MFMASAGLLYVGAVLFMNGLMLLRVVDSKAAAIFNLFVGGLQVITPTYLIFTAGGDQNQILSAAGLYLFAFTYLYVGIGILANIDTTGVGYFSLFVAIMAVALAFANFFKIGDPAFGVIWLYWALLWALFFVVLGLKREWLTRYTGWVSAIQGWVTGAIPAYLMLAGWWTGLSTWAIVLAVFGIVVFLALIPFTRGDRRVSATHTVRSH
jgi:putative amide transporter protein